MPLISIHDLVGLVRYFYTTVLIQDYHGSGSHKLPYYAAHSTRFKTAMDPTKKSSLIRVD